MAFAPIVLNSSRMSCRNFSISFSLSPRSLECSPQSSGGFFGSSRKTNSSPASSSSSSSISSTVAAATCLASLMLMTFSSSRITSPSTSSPCGASSSSLSSPTLSSLFVSLSLTTVCNSEITCSLLDAVVSFEFTLSSHSLTAARSVSKQSP